jgi:hypothetical protein
MKLLVFYFRCRLGSRTRETPAHDGSWPSGSSKESVMFTVLIVIAVLVCCGLYFGRRLRRHF